MGKIFKYDVFISHSPKDKPAVRMLAYRLISDGLRVWLDDRESMPGDMIGFTIQQRLELSRTLVLVMSANAFSSDWATLENHTILFRDPTNAYRRFIPLRLDDTEIKGTLKQFAYIDWRQKSEDQYARLLAACKPPKSEIETVVTQHEESIESQIITNHTAPIFGVGITSNGQLAISGASDGSLQVWNLDSRSLHMTLERHNLSVMGVAITPDGKNAISGSSDGVVKIWDLDTSESIDSLQLRPASLRRVAIASNGQLAVWGSSSGNLVFFNRAINKYFTTPDGHTGIVWGVAITADGTLVVSGSTDRTVGIWDLRNKLCLTQLEGHADRVAGVAVTPDGKIAASGSDDMTVRVWDLSSNRCVAILEGHTSSIEAVALTPDGQLLVSGSNDGIIRIWELREGKCLALLNTHTDKINSVAITANGQLMISGSNDGTLLLYELPERYRVTARGSVAARYTNAKVLLVGDSGVGKSGLAYRLTENRFEPTISTDAAWATQLKLPHETSSGEIEREIWLWDFAGQADYRLIHQLFMDETSLAVLVFNPQSDNPFEGLGQWDRDLQRAARRSFKKLLVAGRCDRGGVMVSRNSIDSFRIEREYVGYIETSAYTGKGCSVLREAIISNIPWDEIPWTASPHIFKLLKATIIKLKDEGNVLLRIGELKQHLEMRLPDEGFTVEQLRAVIGLLAGPGVVWQLEFGDFVLLQPERVNSYAAAVIRKVRSHTEEIGVIPEEDVLSGKLDYQDMKRLPDDEEQIVLRAMHQSFIDHGLCLREPTEAGTLLVFPSYFKRERPKLEDHPAVFITYQFNGQLDEIYSTLVVRLHHTPAFEKDQLWRFAADFKTQADKRVGLKMTKRGEGAADIAVYCAPGVPDDTKVTFIRYIHEHLKIKAQDIIRLRHYVCPHCGTPVKNRETALERLNDGLKDILCVKCEKRIPLWDLIEQKFASEEFQQRVRMLEEQSRISIDNESKELILVGHAFAVAGEAGQIFRPTPNSDWGIDGEIEFKNKKGEASGKRVYLQLKSGDSYLYTRRGDGKEIFNIKNARQAEYWRAHAYPVMLTIRSSDGQIRWMNVSDYLNRHAQTTRQIIFEGENFTAMNIIKLRDRLWAE